MAVNFSSISHDRARAMRTVLSLWQSSGSSVAILEEGLMVLSTSTRPSAESLLRSHSPFAHLACTYGKGQKAKLLLPQKDAAMLHELVVALRTIISDENRAGLVVERAASILLDGQRPPATISDPSWQQLLTILAGFEPTVTQRPLF